MTRDTDCRWAKPYIPAVASENLAALGLGTQGKTTDDKWTARQLQQPWNARRLNDGYTDDNDTLSSLSDKPFSYLYAYSYMPQMHMHNLHKL